jgi:hypothetical protein
MEEMRGPCNEQEFYKELRLQSKVELKAQLSV